MQITRSSLHHAKGPEFTGDVYIGTVAAPTEPGVGLPDAIEEQLTSAG